MQIEYFDNLETYEESIRQKRLKLFDSMPEKKSSDSKVKILKILELEYEDLDKQQKALIYSNEEMLNSDPNDIDIIEYRAENMKFIQKNIIRMKEIKDEILNLDKNHQIKEKAVLEINDFDKLNLKNIEDINGRKSIEYDIVKEIEL